MVLGQQRWNEGQGNEMEDLMSHTHWWETEKNRQNSVVIQVGFLFLLLLFLLLLLAFVWVIVHFFFLFEIWSHVAHLSFKLTVCLRLALNS